MANNVMINACIIPASEILSETVVAIFESVHAAKAVLVQKENFKNFSAYLERIAFALKELSKFDINDSDIFKNAVEALNRQVTVAKHLTLECSSRNNVYLLLNCRKIAKCLERTTKEIGRALGLIPLASLDVSSGIDDEISKLCKIMLDAEYRTAIAEEEILEKIESGIQERNVDRSYANSLVIRIAEAIGISTEQSELRYQFEGFKTEIDNVELRKDMAEVLQMEQIISLLEKADVTATPAERERKYFNKRNSLGKHPLEPLQSFYCPITGDVMEDPVETSSGHTFERSAIEKWLADSNLCPLTKTPLSISAVRSNRTLRQSIEEWKDRNTMITIANMKPKIQSNEEEEVLHYLGKLQDLCMERKMHQEWLLMEDYVPILIELLCDNNCKIREHVLVILCILAKSGDENKVTIAKVDKAIEFIVRSLARKVEESKLALQLLLELSRSNVVRNFIGSVQGCILLLVTMSGSDDTQAAQDARELLDNLSFLNQNVIEMARKNYFGPLLDLLSSGPDSVKMVMAKTLSEVELTDHCKLSLSRDGALGPLLEMLSHSDIEMKKVAVKALQNLSSVPQNGLQIIKEGAVGPLFEILYRHSLSSPSLREHVAATVMHLAISTTAPEADQLTVSFLESDEDIFKFFSLISLTGPDVQQSILRAFYAMCQSASGLDIRTNLRKLSAVQVLVQLCELDNHMVRANAVKLFCCLTEDCDDSSTFLEHVGQRCIDTLLRIIKTSNNVEEIVASMCIISNLPKDPQMTRWLLDSGALEVIFSHLTSGNSNASYKSKLIESACGALCRFTVPTNQEWQKKIAEAGIIPVLVQLLVSGTALTKQNVARSLKQFSESSNGLSRPVKKHRIFGCCLASPETTCTLHLGVCTLESSFCLLEANAIKPLVGVIEEPDIGACEASLDALLTLIEGEQLQRGSKVLSEANAIAPIIKLLGSSCPRLQERALKSLERLFRLVEFKQQYGSSAQMLLVDITQRGSSGMKSLAAKILAHLNVLQDQSSYF